MNDPIKYVAVLIIDFSRAAVHCLVPSHAYCRFTPTCSQYAKESLEKWGVLKGTLFAVKRLSRCHPWGSLGWDPSGGVER